MQSPNAPLFSIIIPAFNRAPYLKTCLEHLARQSFSSFETLVIDNGSSDNTLELLREMQVKHPELHLRWFELESNFGGNYARNLGIREARGKLIAFIDSDSYAEADWLERMLPAFEDPDVAAANGRIYNVKPRTIYELAYKGSSVLHSRGGELPRLVSANLVVRRNLLLSFPLDEDRKYGCDEEGLYLRLKAAGYRMILVPEAVVLHDHPYDRKSYFRRAMVLGAGAAWLVYKFKLPHRIDLIPFIAAYIMLPFALFDPRFVLLSLAFFGIGCAGLIYNEAFRKRKTIFEIFLSFPIVLVYYQFRLFAYVKESLRLRLFPHDIKRTDLNELKARRRTNKSLQHRSATT